MTLYLGKAPARPGAIRPKFSTYLNTSVLATPPAEFGHDRLVGNWGMLANDSVGDCAIADALHQTMLWRAEAGMSTPMTDACAIANYSAVTDYNAGDPSTDQGTDVPQLVNYRYTTGLKDAAGNSHKIGAAVALEPGNWEELVYALYYSDGVTLGIQMSQQWMDAFQPGTDIITWDKVSRPKNIGGHAITGVAFHDNLARIVTWGTDIVGITDAGYAQASDETYAFFSAEKLKNGVDLNGFDAEKLLADLPLLLDVSTPVPEPTPPATETLAVEAA